LLTALACQLHCIQGFRHMLSLKDHYNLGSHVSGIWSHAFL